MGRGKRAGETPSPRPDVWGPVGGVFAGRVLPGQWQLGKDTLVGCGHWAGEDHIHRTYVLGPVGGVFAGRVLPGQWQL